MRAGSLRSIARIEREVRTPDGRGGASVAWLEVCRTACSVDDAWARERLAGDATEAMVGAAIIVRYRVDIEASQRAVVFSGLGRGTYNIRGVRIEKARGTSRPELLILDCDRGGPL